MIKAKLAITAEDWYFACDIYLWNWDTRLKGRTFGEKVRT